MKNSFVESHPELEGKGVRGGDQEEDRRMRKGVRERERERDGNVVVVSSFG
jgi:hypothetical protein